MKKQTLQEKKARIQELSGIIAVSDRDSIFMRPLRDELRTLKLLVAEEEKQ